MVKKILSHIAGRYYRLCQIYPKLYVETSGIKTNRIEGYTGHIEQNGIAVACGRRSQGRLDDNKLVLQRLISTLVRSKSRVYKIEFDEAGITLYRQGEGAENSGRDDCKASRPVESHGRKKGRSFCDLFLQTVKKVNVKYALVSMTRWLRLSSLKLVALLCSV